MKKYFIENNEEGLVGEMLLIDGVSPFFVRNDYNLTPEEVLKLENGEDPAEVFGEEDEFSKLDWYVSEEEIYPKDLEREEVEGLFDEIGLSVSDQFLDIFMDSLQRESVTRFDGKDLIVNEEGEEIEKNLWVSEFTQAVEFIKDLENGVNIESLRWIVEAWARHNLTDYDEKVGEVEDVESFREEKTKEGIEKMLKDKKFSDLAKDFKSFLNNLLFFLK